MGEGLDGESSGPKPAHAPACDTSSPRCKAARTRLLGLCDPHPRVHPAPRKLSPRDCLLLMMSGPERPLRHHGQPHGWCWKTLPWAASINTQQLSRAPSQG